MQNNALNQETPNPIPSVSRTQEAQAMLARVEAWLAEIPTFSFPLDPANRRAMAVARSIPPEFVEQTTVAASGIGELSRGGTTPEETRDLVSYAIAFSPVADAIDRLAASMRHSVDTAKAKAGAEALVTFTMAERLSVIPGLTHLAPMVAGMRRTLRSTVPRFRARKAKKDVAPVPAEPGTSPTPDTHTTTK
jgi:hypothetical protein